MINIVKAETEWSLTKIKFTDARFDGTYAVSSGIAFPRHHDVGITPKGAVVTFGEKDGVFYELDEFEFQQNPKMLLNAAYRKTQSRRFFYNDSGSERSRLEISRDREIKWRPEFVPAPYSNEDEAKHEFYSLLQEHRLKIRPEGLLYNAVQNMGFQKTNPVLTATFNALTGLLKFPRRRNN